MSENDTGAQAVSDTKEEDVTDADAASATIVVIEDKTKQEENTNEEEDNTKQEDNNKVTVESNSNILKSPPTEKVESNNSSGFGKDFNWEMHEENRKLKEENKIIVDKLRQKQKDITNLEEALTTLHEEIKFLESQEVQSVAKDLAKKNRQLSVQLQRERTRRSQIHIESEKLKSELATFSHHHLSPKKVVEPMSFSKRPDLIGINEEIEKSENIENKKEKDDKEKDEIKQLKMKLMRSKDEMVKYKDMIKKLNIALKKEIGDDTKDFNEIIRDGGNWKGRSEKIAILKNKLNETKRELDLLNDIGRTKENVKTIRNKNEQHKHNISQMAAQRMKQYEDAQIQIEKLVGLNNELRDVLKAKNCRIKGIENNLSSIRKKLQFFIQKSKSDDTLVETLQSQLNEQLKLRNSLNTKQKLLNKNNNELNTLSATMKQQNNKIEILNKTIDEMKEKIINLTQERTDTFKQMFEKFNNDDKSYRIQILQVENEKQKDVILTYKKNLSNLQKRLSRKASPRIDNNTTIHTNRSTAKGSSKISQLKEKMEAMTQEQQLIKASYLSIIEGKEKEIEICRQLNLQQKNNYQQCMKEMKEQMHKLQLEILGT